jgi:hypothetical protein
MAPLLSVLTELWKQRCINISQKNTYRYLDVINKLLTSYISIHSTIGMPPSKVNPANIYFVWEKMNSLRTKIPQCSVKFKVGDLVRLTKKSLPKIWKELFNRNIPDFQGYSAHATACLRTFKLAGSNGSFIITSLSRSLYPPNRVTKR